RSTSLRSRRANRRCRRADSRRAARRDPSRRRRECLRAGASAGRDPEPWRTARRRRPERSRRPIAKVGGRDRAKAYAIAGREKRRRLARDVEHGERRTADQIPAPGRDERIDASLASADSDGTGGHRGARRRAARRGDRFRKAAQVREAGHEADHVHAVGRARVQAHDVVGREAVALGDVVEIGAELVAVADRNLDLARLGQHVDAQIAQRVLDAGDEARIRRAGAGGDAGRIVVNRDAGERRREVDDPVELDGIEPCRRGAHAPVRRLVDRRAEGDGNRLVAERSEAHRPTIPRAGAGRYRRYARGATASKTRASTKLFNKCSSIIPSRASIARMSSARSHGTARLYGRSVAVSASKMSAIVIIRAGTGMASPVTRRGYPAPFSFSWWVYAISGMPRNSRVQGICSRNR